MSDVNNQSPPDGDILIVDDNKSDLKMLATILRKAGYSTRLASSGELALRSVQAKIPSLILLDVRMPGLDGPEVCRRLKEDARTREIPVVFVSAMTRIPDKVSGFGAGGADYITKPFDAREILARVATHLELARMHAALEARVHARTAELKRINQELRHEIAERQRAEEMTQSTQRQLLDRQERLQKFNQFAVGRERRMIELKHEVNKLSVLLNKEPPYDLEFAETETEVCVPVAT